MWSITELAAQVGYRVVARAELEAREPHFATVPDRLEPTLTKHLKEAWPGGLYSHQTAALEAFLDGRDVCLATSTASGKSLVFMAAATHLLLTDSGSTVLALYPAKALIQDQIGKWKAQLDPFGLLFGYIDGSVPIDSRRDILRASRVVLMTPDVAHAWLLSHLADAEVRAFLSSLRLLVED